MIEPTTGQPDPCPMCGSHDVRWRRRRWYDAVRNEIRFWTESLLNSVFGRPDVATSKNAGFGRTDRHDMTVRWGNNSDIAAMNSELQYGVHRDYYEARIAGTTPSRFWKCRACKRKGHEFGDISSLLAGRDRLAALEDASLSGPEAQMYQGIDRTGLAAKDE